ncbi:MAG: biopolymer transporter ExbD [Acidobacteria bacterium]|nr:biopolymer transporter ExbD [Acidobacteriota bacterium]
MSMDVGGAKGSLKADINVTPLVDVMLVLLIIMMVVAPMLQKGVNVKLPEAANTVEKQDTGGQTEVAIGADKKVFFNKQPIRPDDLAARVSEYLETQADKAVLVKADEAVDYAVVMDTLDRLREAGVEDMGLITERKKTPGGN